MWKTEEEFLEGQGSTVLDGFAGASVHTQELGDAATLRTIHIHLWTSESCPPNSFASQEKSCFK